MAGANFYWIHWFAWRAYEFNEFANLAQSQIAGNIKRRVFMMRHKRSGRFLTNLRVIMDAEEMELYFRSGGAHSRMP